MIGKALITRRLLNTIVFTSAIAALAAQPVFAFDGRSPDTRNAAENATRSSVAAEPDAIARYMIATTAAAAASANEPDAIARALPSLPATTPITAPVDGFGWRDFGIGVGAALGSVMTLALLAATVWTARGRRRTSRRPGLT